MGVKVIAVAAMAENRVIGREGKLPWKLAEDMRHFAALTTGHTVLMGRKTFASLPERYRPLPGRVNVVATRNAPALKAYGASVQACPAAADYIRAVRKGELKLCSEILWIAGGEEIYRITLPEWDEVCLTVVRAHADGDAFFPEFEDAFTLAEREAGTECDFLRYVRKG
jgi:dihydrofolate reductase